MNQFNYYSPQYKTNLLVCGQGKPVIVTGWTKKEKVVKVLPNNMYAAIGNLYSPTRGISPLLRNLLANPQIRHLVILDRQTTEEKMARSCECLADFFRNGFREGESEETGRRCWRVISPVVGYIDIEISGSALECLRDNIDLKIVDSVERLVEEIEEIEYSELPPWGEPLIFEEAKIPSDRGANIRSASSPIEEKTVADAWLKVVEQIRERGQITSNQYGLWHQLNNLTVTITDEPDGFYFPEPNYLPVSPKYIERYVAEILEDRDSENNYTYGGRLKSWFGVDQIERAVNKLAKDPNSTRCVMSLWDARDLSSDHPPCLNLIQISICDLELSLFAFFRSNDMFSAWPANAMGLRALQKHILDEVSKRSKIPLKMGSLTTLSHIAHIYEDCWEECDLIIANNKKRERFDDPCGNFIIRVEDKIIVERTTPGSGETVDCYSGKRADALCKEILRDCPNLKIDHALYLGRELQKAEIALSLNYPYTQDEPIRK